MVDQLMPKPSSSYYYDLDDIMTLQEKVPVHFELPCYRLGFLVAGSGEEHINKGTRLEVPCWLAYKLCSRDRQIVSVELPKIYNESQRQIFKADANVLNLHKLGPYFYKLGLKLLHFQHNDSGIVARTLLEVFVKRFRSIMDAAQNISNTDFEKFKITLDALELQLFDNGQKTTKEFEEWQKGKVGLLKTTNAISLQRKRKRTEMEE